MTLILAVKYREEDGSSGIAIRSDTTCAIKDSPQIGQVRKVKPLNLPDIFPPLVLGMAGTYNGVEIIHQEVEEAVSPHILEDGAEYASAWVQYHLMSAYHHGIAQHQLLACINGNKTQLSVLNRDRNKGIELAECNGIGCFYEEVRRILEGDYHESMTWKEAMVLMDKCFRVAKGIAELMDPEMRTLPIDLGDHVLDIVLSGTRREKIKAKSHPTVINGYEISKLTRHGYERVASSLDDEQFMGLPPV